jgi:hypothetical protein
VTLNFCDPDGTLLDFRRIEELAGTKGISLRPAASVTPEAGETAGDLTEDDMRAGLAEGSEHHAAAVSPGDAAARRQDLGAIRVSLGLASNIA